MGAEHTAAGSAHRAGLAQHARLPLLGRGDLGSGLGLGLGLGLHNMLAYRFWDEARAWA